ncbi:tyrosine-protein kinase receptor Tie-1-like [Acanthaster planci]|uniref:receptor protein-tyrosine kinase n=1 Tax=Acanthaster planci TaxID=133434 RepID=A0A8B8A625_ACAPL|nr:tyrosine-protein kinase receptor Tie-1-like [Acanthaster planci]
MESKAFPRDQLQIVRELGHGAFGLVLLAEATGITERSKVTLVAVKTLKDGASKSDKDGLMKEIDLMKKLPDHCNVVRLLGFCIDKEPLYIIVEYLSRGNLKDLLQDSRSKGGRVYGNLHGISKSLTSRDLMKFAKDVANGMAFISSQKCVHRDLAARNVLVAEDMLCKVSDFGLARDVLNIRVYERGSEGALPMRWMALESLLDDVYTTESDVWSFGVLLWEIVTLGARPYPAMTAKMMVGELQSGYRMPKPHHCQDELYEMMLSCWDEDPENRPTFEVISQELEGLIKKGKEYISVKSFSETIYEAVQPADKEEKV